MLHALVPGRQGLEAGASRKTTDPVEKNLLLRATSPLGRRKNSPRLLTS